MQSLQPVYNINQVSSLLHSVAMHWPLHPLPAQFMSTRLGPSASRTRWIASRICFSFMRRPLSSW